MSLLAVLGGLGKANKGLNIRLCAGSRFVRDVARWVRL